MLTGPSDPLSVLASHTCDKHAHSLRLHLWVSNRTAEPIHGLWITAGTEGGLSFVDRANNAKKCVEVLDGRSNVHIEMSFDVVKFATQRIHLCVSLPTSD